MGSPIRKAGLWMQQLDERILGHLAEEGWSTPELIADDPNFDDLQCSTARVRERCRELTERELIEPVHSDMYEITTWGLVYVRSDLYADTLRRCSFSKY